VGVSVAGVEPEEVTAGAILLELRRIADALEKPAVCSERKDDGVCALRDGHVGYHVTADGRVHWLDEE
jgi:hypothetical protein